jgi:hypothetical protein
MEQYNTLIGVVLEKLQQSYNELVFNYQGLGGILDSHTEEERRNTPELITISELYSMYGEMIEHLEKRMPGLKNEP